jgi:hypothetical protein
MPRWEEGRCLPVAGVQGAERPGPVRQAQVSAYRNEGAAKAAGRESKRGIGDWYSLTLVFKGILLAARRAMARKRRPG